MDRKTELQQRLGPWLQLNDNIDFSTCPDDVWERYLEQADRLVANNKRWYAAGIQRAIKEMECTIDGKPLWPTRQDLIQHLKTIHAPF